MELNTEKMIGEKESGIAVAREGFNVVLTSWFEADEFEEFLFDEGMGMNSPALLP